MLPSIVKLYLQDKYRIICERDHRKTKQKMINTLDSLKSWVCNNVFCFSLSF